MKVVFLYLNYESLGIEYLSAYLKKYGHQTELILDPQLSRGYASPTKSLGKIFSFRKNLLYEIINAKPDLLCFSSVSDYFNWATQLAEDIKSVLDVPIVFGGPHPTAVPENVIRHRYIDFVITGEGEESLLELVNNLENGKDVTNIRNVWCKVGTKIINNPTRPLISNLDSLPFPDKELFYRKRWGVISSSIGINNAYIIIGSRGCPNICSYCHNNYLRRLYKDSKYLRFRSVDNIMQELITAKGKYNFKTVIFWDEVFTCNKNWLRELLERYKKEISLPFFSYSHPNYIDEETVQFLEEAGCGMISLGIQSINENIRKNILLRPESNNDIIRVIRLISKTRISLYIDLIVGLPTETIEDLLDTAKFFNRHKVELISIFWLRHYPKTEIIKYLDKEKVERINEGIFAPWQFGGTSFDKDKGRLINLIILANLIPNFILRLILKIKLYLFFPTGNWHYIDLTLSTVRTKIFSPRKYVFSPFNLLRDYLRYYEYYISDNFCKMFKRFSKNISRRLKRQSNKEFGPAREI